MKTWTKVVINKGLVGLAALSLFAALVLPEMAISATDGNGCSPQFSKNMQPQRIVRRCPWR